MTGSLVEGQTYVDFENGFPGGSRIEIYSRTGGDAIGTQPSDTLGNGRVLLRRPLVRYEVLVAINLDEALTGPSRTVEALLSPTPTPRKVPALPSADASPAGMLLLLVLVPAAFRTGASRQRKRPARSAAGRTGMNP